MAIPIVKVYLQNGSVVIDLVNGVTYTASAAILVAKYVRKDSSTIYDDRVSLYVGGATFTGFQDKFPDSIRDEDGNLLVTGRDQTIDDVQEYFISLGIGQLVENSVDSSKYYTKQQSISTSIIFG